MLPFVMALGGCAGSDSSSTTPTSPTGPLVSESFDGSVSPLGQSFHAFSVAESSEVSAHLTAAGPPSTIFMLLGLGVVTGSTCTPLSNATVLAQASSSPQLAGDINPGAYCVVISDAGNQVQTVSYTVVVNHY
jgi:hypothetical protein